MWIKFGYCGDQLIIWKLLDEDTTVGQGILDLKVEPGNRNATAED